MVMCACVVCVCVRVCVCHCLNESLKSIFCFSSEIFVYCIGLEMAQQWLRARGLKNERSMSCQNQKRIPNKFT